MLSNMHPKKPVRSILPTIHEVEPQPHELRITIPRRKDSDVSEPPPKEPDRCWVVSCLCCCFCWQIAVGCLEG